MEQPPESQPPLISRPRPWASVRSVNSLLVELIIVTAGVLIALSVDSLREWNRHRTLAREAEATIAVEDQLGQRLSELYASALK
jgi:hypothetical protein